MEKAKVTFEQAIELHQRMLAAFGENDPRTVDAALVVMLLAPDSLFNEIDQMANATQH